ncbi:zinc ribbon domain-containing protein [Enterococcus hirae]|uniref:zinc ribbon domain-containing protein n=1 Tax=Enterococcus hirae TaxID=1354 RepID=UPI0035AE3A4C
MADVSWSEFVRQLDYKSAWKGCILVNIDRFYPRSQICSSCVHLDEKKNYMFANGFVRNAKHHNRDINANMNIKTEGLSGIT